MCEIFIQQCAKEEVSRRGDGAAKKELAVPLDIAIRMSRRRLNNCPCFACRSPDRVAHLDPSAKQKPSPSQELTSKF